MSEMTEETVDMSEGRPEKAVIDISKAELQAGRYDTFVKALNAALMHLEITDVRAFIAKQDMSGRYKFELHRPEADADTPADVADSKEGVSKLNAVLDEGGVPDETGAGTDGEDEDSDGLV